MLARKGTGKMHAKWSPVATCIMHKQPLVKIDEDIVNRQLSVDDRKKIVELCPRKVFNFNKMLEKVEVVNQDDCNFCIECSRYTEAMDYEKAVVLKEDDHKFIFTVESTGALPPQEIVRKALEILNKKIENFSNELQNKKFANMG